MSDAQQSLLRWVCASLPWPTRKMLTVRSFGRKAKEQVQVVNTETGSSRTIEADKDGNLPSLNCQLDVTK